MLSGRTSTVDLSIAIALVALGLSATVAAALHCTAGRIEMFLMDVFIAGITRFLYRNRRSGPRAPAAVPYGRHRRGARRRTRRAPYVSPPPLCTCTGCRRIAAEQTSRAYSR